VGADDHGAGGQGRHAEPGRAAERDAPAAGPCAPVISSLASGTAGSAFSAKRAAATVPSRRRHRPRIAFSRMRQT
jgi:hypothetical protein